MDTLDKLHASQIKIINENKEKLPKYVSELNELTATNEKLNLDEYDKLKNLKSNIEKIKNDKVDYYMKTGEILFQYYDNLESGGTAKKSYQIKSLPGKQSIVSYFSNNNEEEKSKDTEVEENTAKNTFEKGLLSKDLPTVNIKHSEIMRGMNILEIVLVSKLITSKSEIRRVIKNKGIRINNKLIENEKILISVKDFIDNLCKVSFGKKKHVIIKLS